MKGGLGPGEARRDPEVMLAGETGKPSWTGGTTRPRLPPSEGNRRHRYPASSRTHSRDGVGGRTARLPRRSSPSAPVDHASSIGRGRTVRPPSFRWPVASRTSNGATRPSVNGRGGRSLRSSGPVDGSAGSISAVGPRTEPATALRREIRTGADDTSQSRCLCRAGSSADRDGRG